jgi:sugar/nucleoside kinase (ribokinase family)
MLTCTVGRWCIPRFKKASESQRGGVLILGSQASGAGANNMGVAGKRDGPKTAMASSLHTDHRAALLEIVLDQSVVNSA